MVARRIEEAVAVVGDRERVIASTDCGFGTFTRREWVIEPVVWLKLNRSATAPTSPRPGCGAGSRLIADCKHRSAMSANYIIRQ